MTEQVEYFAGILMGRGDDVINPTAKARGILRRVLMKRERVCTDFSGTAYEALLAMCQEDYRLPDDEIRYLVVAAARQRGLLPKEGNASPPVSMNMESLAPA